ncbi:MAG: hypothetical protein Q4C83_01445 [Candidatus Saccharibacteria bacterium]|nr:hypothetical protein [Candidatus Saccharibacteria bacterium]
MDNILAIIKNYINDAQSVRILGEYTYEQQRATLVNIKAKQGTYTGCCSSVVTLRHRYRMTMSLWSSQMAQIVSAGLR